MQALTSVFKAFESLECSKYYFDGVVSMKSLLVDSTSLSNQLSEAAEESDPEKKSDLIGRVVLLSYISAVILLVSYCHQSTRSVDDSSNNSCKDYLIRFDAGKNPCLFLFRLLY